MTVKQFNTLLFGTNGTGKTTVMLDLFYEYMLAKESLGVVKNGLFLMPDDAESKYDDIPEINVNDLGGNFGIAKIICDVNATSSDKKAKSIYTEIYERYACKKRKFDGLIVNDDMAMLMNRRPNDIITMCSRRRQMNLDLLWNFHGLTTDCPKAFWRYVTSIILFKTADDYTDTYEKISKPAEFEKLYFEVQSISNGVMLDAKGNFTENKDKAVYNSEQKHLPYYKGELNLIS